MAEVPLSILGEGSDRRVRWLFRDNPEPVFLLDERGEFLAANPAAERVTGYALAELRQRGWQGLVAPMAWSATAALLAAPRGTDAAKGETTIVARDGRRVDLWLVFGRLDDDHAAPGGVCYARDITELKQAQRTMLTTEEIYRHLADSIPHLAWICRGDARTIVCNSRWLEYTGQSQTEALGDGWMRALHPDDVERVFREVRDVVAQKRVYQVEYRLRRQDGVYRWHLARANPILDRQGELQYWFGSAADIEDYKQLEAELRRTQAELESRVAHRTGELTAAKARLEREMTERHELELALLAISDRERATIGQELHDGVCQQLSAIALLGQMLAGELVATDPAAAHRVEEIGRLVGQSAQEARALARGLSPFGVELGNLNAALEKLASQIASLFRVVCRVEATTPLVVADSVAAHHLYRIAQEAAANAVRHGQARHITFRTALVDGQAWLVIVDDGSGIAEPAVEGTGMGLRIMRHRAVILGGCLSIRRAATDGGTIVECIFPMDDNGAGT